MALRIALSLDSLSTRLIVLLAICIAQRLQTLKAITLDQIQRRADGYSITIPTLIKTSRPGYFRPLLELPIFPENRKLCIPPWSLSTGGEPGPLPGPMTPQIEAPPCPKFLGAFPPPCLNVSAPALSLSLSLLPPYLPLAILLTKDREPSTGYILVTWIVFLELSITKQLNIRKSYSNSTLPRCCFKKSR